VRCLFERRNTRGCVIFLFRVLRWGGKVKMEWDFINSVTIQLAKIVFQNFLYSKKGLPEQNLLLDESQEKIWD
jgi:hypothetical protein